MKLEEKLVALRKEKGLSQLKLAEMMDVSRQAVSRWEVGTAVPSTDNLKYLGRLYDVPLEYLLHDDAPEPVGLDKEPGQERSVKDVEYSKEFDFPDNSEFSCAINATIRTYSDFGHTRWIDEVVMMSTRRVSGRYSYEWIEEDKTSIISADKKSVKLMAMGHFSVTTSEEINASVELPGFSVGSSSGGTYLYLSNTMRPTGTYYAP